MNLVPRELFYYLHDGISQKSFTLYFQFLYAEFVVGGTIYHQYLWRDRIFLEYSVSRHTVTFNKKMEEVICYLEDNLMNGVLTNVTSKLVN